MTRPARQRAHAAGWCMCCCSAQRRGILHGVGTTQPQVFGCGFLLRARQKIERQRGERKKEREREAHDNSASISKGTPKPPDQTRDAHCWKHLHAPHCVEFFALRFNPYSEWCHKTVVSVDSSFQGEWGPCSLAAAARRRHTMAAAAADHDLAPMALRAPASLRQG